MRQTPLVTWFRLVLTAALRRPEQQRAKLAMLGLEPKVVEREVNGRTMYRVRLGPFATRELADEVRVKLNAASVESALVRVQK